MIINDRNRYLRPSICKGLFFNLQVVIFIDLGFLVSGGVFGLVLRLKGD
ncbi:hypothetical protein HanIR_Chr14g0727481 [Helianthus annuus]|nr:hypothetical protein HanIR_Chr14g0727481 [Helianthus annuus]